MLAKQKKFQSIALTAMALAVFAVVPSSLLGASIPLGNGAVLDLSNMSGQLVGVSNACINWGIPSACQTTTGIQDTVSGNDSTVFTNGSTSLDTIKDLPAGVLIPLVDFMTVQSPLTGSEVFFDLTGIVIPAIPVGNNCTIFALSAICNAGGGSPFLLVQTGDNQVSISFDTTEIAYTGNSTSGSTPYVSVFTTQISGTLLNGNTDTIPNILNYVAGGGAIDSTWSASQSPVVPEPMSFILLGSGLLGMGLLSRWSRRS